MRRLACGCLVWLVAGAGTAMADATEASPRASLTDRVCRASSNPLNRAVGITAVMRPLAGTFRMELMFGLEERSPRGGPYAMVQGQGLGRWIRPSKPLDLGRLPSDVWRVDKPVANLPAPAVYRFRVVFRWIDASGSVLGRAVRLSPSCYQPQEG